VIENLKPLYNATLRPFAKLCNRAGIHPNHITLSGTLFFIVAGYFSAVGRWYCALVMVILGGIFDGLDGVLARESGKKSTFGAILDSSCDRITEIALILGLLAYYLTNDIHSFWGPVLCFTGMSGSLMVSYVKARCEGVDVPCKSGILQRPERLILLCIGLLLGVEVMFWILLVITVFSIFTAIQRLFEAAKYCRNISVQKR